MNALRKAPQRAQRVVAWFSAGAASAVATKLVLSEYGHENVLIAYCDVGSEHPDNERFRSDCEAWFGHPVTVLRSPQYASVDEVIERRKYIVGTNGAPCSLFLKKRVRQEFEDPADIQVFGYTADAADIVRAGRFRAANPDVDLVTPLIEHGLTKSDVLALVERAGIEIPAMYRLGYANNNCIGCVKGGIGYWNRIRVDFPDVFARRAAQERRIGHSILSDRTGPIWLDELDPERGRHAKEPSFDCSLLCAAVEDEIAGAS